MRNVNFSLRLAFAGLLLLCSGWPALAVCQNVSFARGIVFEDLDRDGRRDAGEPGIPGVAVSNQIDVVLTDQSGGYALPITNESIIFVSKPAGYQVPVNDDNLPQFYYIHQPAGSPDLSYPGIEPTGNLPESIDFPLQRVHEPNPFSVLVFADPQPKTQAELDYFRDDIVAELLGMQVAFGVTLGDIMYDDLSLWPRYNRIVGQIGIPIYNIPGNHDMNFDAPDDHYALETFKRYCGPPYYSFNYSQVHFIVLDDVEYLGRDPETGTPRYRGELGESQLRWLSRDLAIVPPERLIVLLMHIPLYSPQNPSPGINVVNRDKLFALLQRRPHVLALAGHMHETAFVPIGSDGGWQGAEPLAQYFCTAASGAWWSGPKDDRGIPVAYQIDGTPNGYHLFIFEGNRFRQQYIASGQGPRTQLRICAPQGRLSAAAADTTQVIVNVYNGSDQWQLRLRVDSGPEVVMTRTPMVDPFLQKVYLAHKKDFKSFVEPGTSKHIWTAPLGTALQPGVHQLRVFATDPYGETFTAGAVIEIY